MIKLYELGSDMDKMDSNLKTALDLLFEDSPFSPRQKDQGFILYSWGKNVNFGLGTVRLAGKTNVNYPKLIPDLRNIRFEKVSCSKYHTCGLSFDGMVYTWGFGKAGQLGYNRDVQIEPLKIPPSFFGGDKVVDISTANTKTVYYALIFILVYCD